MTYLQALILGVIQGITEFLPISSSGHLVIVPYLLGWNLPKEQVFPFDVLVQFSTLFAVLIYYRKDIIQIAQAMMQGIREKKPFNTIESRVGWLTALATVPAGLAGLLLKDVIADAFSNPQLAAASLLITAVILFLSEKLGKKSRKLDQLNWVDAIIMGIAQALAIFPGISRSGSTISGGLYRNLDRKTAGQFAFLMAIPIMTAAGAVSIIDLLSMPALDGFFMVMVIGFVTSGVVGFFSIKWLINYISNHDLTPFAIYCAAIGIGTLAISFIPTLPFNLPNEPQSVSPLIVAYQPAASWMVPEMQSCLEGLDEPKGILLEKSDGINIPENTAIYITYGELEKSDDLIYQLGSDSITFAASTSSPIENLPLPYLQRIISGEIVDFQDLANSCPDCMNNKNATAKISTWTYPEGSSVSILIRNVFQFSFSSDALIAPNPSQMIQILKSDPASIGLLPSKMVDAELKNISIETSQNVPILLYSQATLDKGAEQWVLCLQNQIEDK